MPARTDLPRTAYQFFDIAPESSMLEIRLAYQRLRHKCHPDNAWNTPMAAAAKTSMETVNRWYALIRTEEAREAYDRSLQAVGVLATASEDSDDSSDSDSDSSDSGDSDSSEDSKGSKGSNVSDGSEVGEYSEANEYIEASDGSDIGDAGEYSEASEYIQASDDIGASEVIEVGEDIDDIDLGKYIEYIESSELKASETSVSSTSDDKVGEDGDNVGGARDDSSEGSGGSEGSDETIKPAKDVGSETSTEIGDPLIYIPSDEEHKKAPVYIPSDEEHKMAPRAPKAPKATKAPAAQYSAINTAQWPVCLDLGDVMSAIFLLNALVSYTICCWAQTVAGLSRVVGAIRPKRIAFTLLVLYATFSAPRVLSGLRPPCPSFGDGDAQDPFSVSRYSIFSAYDVLNLPNNHSLPSSAIRKAYHEAIRAYHPDKSGMTGLGRSRHPGHPVAALKDMYRKLPFVQMRAFGSPIVLLSDAYAVLTDPYWRCLHDADQVLWWDDRVGSRRSTMCRHLEPSYVYLEDWPSHTYSPGPEAGADDPLAEWESVVPMDEESAAPVSVSFYRAAQTAQVAIYRTARSLWGSIRKAAGRLWLFLNTPIFS